MGTAAEVWLEQIAESGQPRRLRWCSPAGRPAPLRVVPADRHTAPGAALALARQGTALLWQDDYPAARQFLNAWSQQLPAPPAAPGRAPAAAFAAQREAQARRTQLLSMLLVPVQADHRVALRRAPQVGEALRQVVGDGGAAYAVSLRELLGMVGAYEWRRRGVPIEALGARIHPHYGVFSPIRGEYVDLVAAAPLPAPAHSAGAFDIGTGTGVLAAVLARRGLTVLATEIEPRALACAAENFARLGLADAVTLVPADLYPAGRAGLVVCNPPWVPAAPATALDAAVYDPQSRMLRRFLAGLASHLVAGGEGWLILSDLAERLDLRPRAALLRWIAAGGLQVLGRLDARPRHGRANDTTDALHAQRRAEVTSLWRLGLVDRAARARRDTPPARPAPRPRRDAR